MEKCHFVDKNGSFVLEQPEQYSYLYFPLAGETGLKSVVTPSLGGDSKQNQNAFLLEPVSVENLHNNRSTRNFWCNVSGKGCWSATGVSAENIAKRFGQSQEKNKVEAGFMWHKVSRINDEYGLKSEILSFVPVDANVEIMQVEITNTGSAEIEFVPTAVIPMYGRSADDLRDHRHVTSLLHRTSTFAYGVQVTPTLSFDERGHQKNDLTYFVCGTDENGNAPQDFYPTVDDIVEKGGNFEQPYAVFCNQKGMNAGIEIEGKESVGGLHFAARKLMPGESAAYTILMGITADKEEINQWIERFAGKAKVMDTFEKTKLYWDEKVNVAYKTGDEDFNLFMKWVSFQPMLRRIFGCSFLPHHDYGKGGRGWRDLWQDCLALLIMNPSGVRQMLTDNFAGVRIDGSNATIIGTKQGEFIADRNNITRVWMDHGVWPFMTTKLYIDQTGDLELLDRQVPYFKDKQIARGTRIDLQWKEEDDCWQKTEGGASYEGSILEHLLVQNLTAFYEVGEHNIIRLRGADWNDALDMAPQRGESVAFTNAYAGNLKDMAELLKAYGAQKGQKTIKLAKEMLVLLKDDNAMYDSIEAKLELLEGYLKTCEHFVTGEKVEVEIDEVVSSLLNKSQWMMEHIRQNEWVKDKEGNGWFNGYYDNSGNAVEGQFEQGVRMMLTGQVFSIMAGTANDEQIEAIVKSADCHLYQEDMGGYRLNTDFHELKTDLGRMFGFSYGDKENGAVFSHMAVMYANALYKRGYVKEGFKALNSLYKQAMNFEKSQIYPGIPEYFDGRGRGLYHYLTGAASWYMLTAITQMYGVHGELGDLVLEPKLLLNQFDENGNAAVQMLFGGRMWKITYQNTASKEYGSYVVSKVVLDGKEMEGCVGEQSAWVEKSILETLDEKETHTLVITLE